MAWDRNSGKYAEEQGKYAKLQGDYAKSEASNLLALKANVLNEADNARTQADYAKAKGDYAKSQGESIEIQETERQANESQRILNESDRQTSEDERNTNEASRTYNENVRKTSESDRITNENARKTNESTRIDNENTRQTNEASRETAESTRITNENTRETDEATRKANETARISNEDTRQSNETTRQTQESERQTNTTNAINSTKINWKNPVATYNDIATTYPSPVLGDTTQVESDTTSGNNGTYRYDGANWIKIHSPNGYATTSSVTAVSDRTNTLETQLSEQEQQTQTLVHGTNIINSDQASPLKVEFYGNTLVNPISDFNRWTLHANATIDSDKKITLNATNGFQYSTLKVSGKENQNYLLKVKHNGVIYLEFLDSTNTRIRLDSTSNQYLNVVSPTGTTSIVARLDGGGSTAGGTFTFEEPRLYAISTEVANKIGDLSLTGDDVAYVEREFPYVDGIKGVKNPVLSVSGSNLLPPFTEWNLHANAEVISPYELELNATGNTQNSEIKRDALPNQTYAWSIAKGQRLLIQCLDANGTQLSRPADYTTSLSGSFTTHANTAKLNIAVSNGLDGVGTYTFSQPMLNLGTTALPFVEKNDSYLYAETTLYGNDVEKDILYRNESLDVPRWEVKREFKGRALTGDDSWTFANDYAGFKGVYHTLSSIPVNYSAEVVKHDGSLLKNIGSGSFVNSNEQTIYNTNSRVYITIADTDSGWGEGYTPTASEMSANFYNWRMCDGTYGTPYNGTGTKTWYPKGDADLSRAVTTVPTSNAPTIAEGVNENYFLLYERSESVIEPVTVEGDLSIQGDAQVSVGEGVIPREEFVAQKGTSGGYADYYYFNVKDGAVSQIPNGIQAKNRVDKVIEVYKNGKRDELWDIITNTNAYGEQHLSILATDFDTSATYSFSYTVLDKHDFTTNLNEVKATFNKTLKSSIYSMVAKQTDQGTQISINKNSIVDIYAILKTNGLI